MDLNGWVTVETVDPVTRGHVYSLVSAVGGSSLESDGRYVLGDDALACLKDIRRWLRVHDNKQDSHDVARCLAEANIVKGDLCEILALWTEDRANDVLRSKAAMAALEILVPLTWPLEFLDDEPSMNHLKHTPYLQLAQTNYKRTILQHDAMILRTAVRLALPSMNEPRRERSPRDDGIITIALYFLRNIASISIPGNVPYDGDGAEVSRSATIEAFDKQDIFPVLLTVASSIGDEFVKQDVVILEILFHLIKGVDADKLFMEEEKLASSNTNELKSLIQKERAMLAGYAKHAPTRHNRFGTMIWVKRDEDKVSTLSGQDVLSSHERSLDKMDKTKKWNKPRHRGSKIDNTSLDEFDKKERLNGTARQILREFVEEFLDSSFNPLFTHLRKAMEVEAPRLCSNHRRQFCYLISWFLQAECARRARDKKRTEKANGSSASEDDSFALVASVMNQETFIFLNRFMQRSVDEKSWRDLNASMKCLTSILHTTQEMADSTSEDDQEIAENILNRIFYEESTHDRIITLLRSYKDQGFGYLDACTELAHVFIRMLERYSKQNVDLQVRTRRRAREKAKAAAQANRDAEDHGDAANDEVEAHRVSTERKFDFTRFSARFMTQGCVDTFVAFTRFYNDLDLEQLKRAHRFFYRLAFKNELAVLLYRVDILNLFNKMIKGPDGLPSDLPVFREWQEFVKQLFKKCVRKVQERPELVVEMLFSKIPSTMYYLEYGHEKEIATRAPRPPAELEVKGDLDKKGQIGVAVSLLISQNKMDHLAWLRNVLSSAATDREAWEKESQARKTTSDGQETTHDDDEASKAPSIMVKPDHDERRIALFKDNKLRLLLKVVGFMRTGLDDDTEASWIVPSNLTSEELRESERLIQQAEWDPPTFEDKSAEDMVRTRRRRLALRDDTDMSDDDDGPDALDDEELFPAGGPTARKSDSVEEKKTRSRRRRNSSEEPDDAEKERRKKARQLKELEKRRKIKSDVLIHSSDEESDEEKDKAFFAAEEERRKNTSKAIVKALLNTKLEEVSGNEKKRKSLGKNAKGRKRTKTSSSDEDHDGGDDIVALSSRSSSEAPAPPITINSDDDSDSEVSDTSLSPQQVSGLGPVGDMDKEPDEISTKVTKEIDMADGDEDDEAPVRRPVRRRAGFLVDSDSE
ncbi:timeless protein-domain-containing protein [Phyllosticta citrichinensis]|uniref:Topoisomerase 1-associated factor 1 n=1 Tax=Phyllosticta citrichinensis TaxID=1130410 RepID=A0ABR1XWD0_9PEZI